MFGKAVKFLGREGESTAAVQVLVNRSRSEPKRTKSVENHLVDLLILFWIVIYLLFYMRDIPTNTE